MPLPPTPEDLEIFRSLLRLEFFDGDPALSPGDLTLGIARCFIGTPFLARSLEKEGEEALVINLCRLDCFTFVENVVALAGVVMAGKKDFADFSAVLKRIRYREGMLDGFASRLHYFSDWLWDNANKGVLRDVTLEIGGEPFSKRICFMTANRDNYPALDNQDNYRRMQSVEKACSERRLCHIPKAGVAAAASRIRNGDIIAVTTDAEGLDVIHVGFAVIIKNRLHLLHASQVAGKVIVSGETLPEYLASKSTRMGIMVARVL